jgi:pyrroloquinoline-quinone synthase
MHPLIEMLNAKIESKHLLKHPFYVAWSRGELTLDDLRIYSRQYFAQVRAFPIYLSEMHSRSEDLAYRKIIAGNLAEEEGGTATHPELWLDFAAGMGADRESVVNAAPSPKVAALVETFRCAARMETGLAAVALYCYEKQLPAIAAAKISGLQERYEVTDLATLRYFAVHETADVKHAAEWERLIERANPDASDAARVADGVLDALWLALDEIHGALKSQPARVH